MYLYSPQCGFPAHKSVISDFKSVIRFETLVFKTHLNLNSKLPRPSTLYSLTLFFQLRSTLVYI
jgi:hypothetical protein